jgi:uncharacterized protein YndB with AHSA1/START domain
MHMSIHQEATFPDSPERVYELLTDGVKFAAATGRPAKIGAGEGATFSIFGDYIHGQQIELVPGRRVVQASDVVETKDQETTAQTKEKHNDTTIKH